ncbi:MAG: hypothetical protein EBY44_09920 [Actinobacteria bacterium]|nr:hypothetical protein [Actinomycetota bacterium]
MARWLFRFLIWQCLSAHARERFDHVVEIHADGDGPLAQLLDLVLVADAVAAALRERDTTD